VLGSYGASATSDGHGVDGFAEATLSTASNLSEATLMSSATFFHARGDVGLIG